MKDKKNMEFWMFSLDDPELHQFYATQADNASLYCAVYIHECTGNYPPEVKKVLHLRDEAVLLLDPYLIPIFLHLSLNGYILFQTEAFCETNQTKALLKFVFCHNAPEGITDLGCFDDDEKKCLELIYQEYSREYDDFQPVVLRNLIRIMLLLSKRITYTVRLKSGHLLNRALQFMDLVHQYAFQEKKKSFYTSKIGITEKMLSQVLRATFDRTFKEILMYKTIIEAMRMLVFSDKSITQIADELNYDVSDFNKLFMKWKGMSPKDLRVNYRNVIKRIENAY
jgi:AraC-like DNA-binding protein